jgi:hypothetical protein
MVTLNDLSFLIDRVQDAKRLLDEDSPALIEIESVESKLYRLQAEMYEEALDAEYVAPEPGSALAILRNARFVDTQR